MIQFLGTRTSARERQRNGGWPHSVLQRAHVILRNSSSNWQSVSHLMSDASQAVFKIKGLMRMIASGETATLQTRMQTVDMSRSVARAIAIDADSEAFERVATSFAGIGDIIEKDEMRIASAARVPVTILMGRSPGGLNSTGESDTRGFYDRVRTAQINKLQPKIEHLIRLIFKAADGPTNGQEPERWSIKFKPLWQTTPEEEAGVRKTTSETDKNYVDSGVLLPEEVAIARFRPEGYSTELAIDLEERKAMLESETADRLEKPRTLEEPEKLEPKAPEPPVKSEAKPEDAADPKTAFNGAQVQALQGVLEQIIAGAFPRETAAAMLSIAFPLSLEEAAALVATVPESFDPKPSTGGSPDAKPSGIEPTDDSSGIGVQPGDIPPE